MSAVTPNEASSLVRALDHFDLETPVRRAGCRDTCALDAATECHHARLTTMESDQDAPLELFELALTWHELEYSETPTIPPDQWMAFVENHRWSDPDRVERIFSVATDLVMTVGRATKQREIERRWIGHDRLLFASDEPWGDHAGELARLRAAAGDGELGDMILRRNFDALYG